MSCLGYALSIDNYRGNEERWILVGCIFGVFLLGGVATGIIMRKNMARVILLVILYLMVIGWTILGVIWFREIGNFQREMIKFTAMPIIFSISIYFLLFSFITFLNNPKLKEEFGIKEE